MSKSLSFLFLICVSTAAQAEVSGKTADGCSYRIINGKYLTDCSAKEKARDTVSTKSAAAASSSPAPVLNYDSVPMRENNKAPQSSFGSNNTQSSLSIPVSAPAQSALVIDREEKLNPTIIQEPEKVRSYKFKEKTYLGFGVGSNSIRQSTAGSSTGLGLEIGTNIDDILGIELNYSYTKQGLNLGLGGSGSSSITSSTDSNLTSNLFAAEVQFHLTETQAKIRPFLGGGLGMKFSTLEENSSLYGQPSYGSKVNPGSLSQQSIGAAASAGAKIRLSRKIDLIGKFSYFAPIIRQNAQIQDSSSSPTQLTQEDSALTGSSQYQILGGLHYIF